MIDLSNTSEIYNLNIGIQFDYHFTELMQAKAKKEKFSLEEGIQSFLYQLFEKFKLIVHFQSINELLQNNKGGFVGIWKYSLETIKYIEIPLNHGIISFEISHNDIGDLGAIDYSSDFDPKLFFEQIAFFNNEYRPLKESLYIAFQNMGSTPEVFDKLLESHNTLTFFNILRTALSRKESTRIIGYTIIAYMQKKGKYLIDKDDYCYYFFNDDKSLYEIGTAKDHHIDIIGFLNQYSINDSENEGKFIISEICAYIKNKIKFSTIYRIAHFDRKKRILYFFDGINKIYKLEGKFSTQDKNKEIRSPIFQTLDNGDENIIFLRTNRTEPFEFNANWRNKMSFYGILTKDSENKPREPAKFNFQALISKRLNFVKNEYNIDIKDQEFFIDIYILSILFNDYFIQKIGLCFVGDKHSGKTIALEYIRALFLGFNKKAVPSFSNDERDFRTALINNLLAYFDNVDSNFDSKLNDMICNTITGSPIPLRKLHTTATEIEFVPYCWIAFTSRSPKFLRADVSSRFLFLFTQKFPEERFKLVTKFYDSFENSQNMNLILSELLAISNEIIFSMKNLKIDDEQEFPLRITEFSQFCLIAGKILGYTENEIIDFQKAMGNVQNGLTFEVSSLVYLIDRFKSLLKEKKDKQGAMKWGINNMDSSVESKLEALELDSRFTTSELHDCFKILFPKDYKFSSHVSLGRDLSEMSKSLKGKYQFIRDGARKWYFSEDQTKLDDHITKKFKGVLNKANFDENDKDQNPDE